MYATDPTAEFTTIMLAQRRLLRVVGGTLAATMALAVGTAIALVA
jgi:hypothetical protein